MSHLHYFVQHFYDFAQNEVKFSHLYHNVENLNLDSKGEMKIRDEIG